MSLYPNAFILAAPGTNCERETKDAYEYAGGGSANIVQIEQWRSGEVSLNDSQALIIPGGFSHGDDIASGRIVGLEMRTRFAEELNQFVEAGKPIVGICNGFQILIESGLLPDGRIEAERNKNISLINNQNNRFEWGWGRLLVNPSICRYISEDLVGRVVELPYAHQEGRVAARDMSVLDLLADRGQVVFSYVDDDDQVTEDHPFNPNGSPQGITGICDEAGIVLGLMPHPERAVLETQLRNWRRKSTQTPFGLEFFSSLVEYAEAV